MENNNLYKYNNDNRPSLYVFAFDDGFRGQMRLVNYSLHRQEAFTYLK